MITRKAGVVAAVIGAVAVVAAVGVVAFTLTSTNRQVKAKPTTIAVPTPVTTDNPSKAPSLPKQGVYLGAYVQGKGFSQPDQIAAVQGLQQKLGRNLQIVHSYLRSGRFPTKSQEMAWRQGSTVLLSWTGADSRDVIAGKFDSVIRERALAMKATHHKIFLEWRWEMNREAMKSVVHSASDFIRAWDHVRAIFTQEKVQNVAWVWCPSSKGWGDVPGYLPGPSFYPGNKEVDWLCADAYPSFGSYDSFGNLLHPFLAWASHISKPVMIGEFGAPRSYSSKQRVKWLNDMARTVRSDSQIKALVYFDGSPAGRPAISQYGLTPGTAPFKEFRSIAHQQYFELGGLVRPPR
jgi:hypothetical protein